MSTFKERIQVILREAIDVPPAIHQSYEHQFSGDFLEYIKNVENGVRKGYNAKTDRWSVIGDPNGRDQIIGYGHKLRPGDNFSKGISEADAIRLLNQDLNIARDKARKEVDASYGLGLFAQLPLKSQEMLTDFVYNLGSLRSFPKFTRAVLTNDVATMNLEYKRFTNGRELEGRNREFQARYLTGLPNTKKPIG